MISEDKWARHYRFCKKCKSTESRHVQNGLCVKCFSKARYKKNKKDYKEHFKNYYEKNKEKLSAKRKEYYLKRKELLKK